MRIYIIRHADPDYENDTITQTGHEQAQILAQYLDTLKIDEIYASPLGRTQATARYTADRLGLPVKTELWLRELEGVWIKDLNRSVAGIAPVKQPIEQSLTEARSNLQFYQPDPCLMEENMALIRRGSDSFMRRQGFLRSEEVYQVGSREPQSRRRIHAHGRGSGVAGPLTRHSPAHDVVRVFPPSCLHYHCPVG